MSFLYIRSYLICVHIYTQSFGSQNTEGTLQKVLPAWPSTSPPSPGGRRGGVILVVWEIVQRDLPGCEDDLRGWCFGRVLLVFV